MAMEDLTITAEVEDLCPTKMPTQREMVNHIGRALVQVPETLRKDAAMCAVKYVQTKAKTHLLGLLLRPCESYGCQQFVEALLRLPFDIQKAAAGHCMNVMNSEESNHLLGLPAEIRNDIISYAVVQNTSINIQAPLAKHPPLMDTCKWNMHNAVAGIYYSDNKFNMLIRDFGGAKFASWLYMKRMYQGGQDSPKNVELSFIGFPHWKNLLEWLEAYHAYKTYGPMETTPPLVHSSVYALFRAIDVGLTNLPWDQAKAVLTEMRPLLASHCPSWNINH